MRKIFIALFSLLNFVSFGQKQIQTYPQYPGNVISDSDHIFGYHQNADGSLTTYQYDLSSLIFSDTVNIVGVTRPTLDSGLATRMNALSVTTLGHGGSTATANTITRLFDSSDAVAIITLPNNPPDKTINVLSFLYRATSTWVAVLKCQGGQKFNYQGVTATVTDTLKQIGETVWVQYRRADSSWIVLSNYYPPPTIDMTLNNGDVAGRGIYFQRPSDASFTLYAGQRRQNGPDGSAQIIGYDTLVGGLHHAQFSLAAGNSITAASLHLFGGGDQLVSTHNDAIFTAGNADAPTSPVMQLNDMHLNKINVYPASIKFTDGQFSSGNSINMHPDSLSGSQDQIFPNLTGIYGVSKYGQILAATNTSVSNVTNVTPRTDASFMVSAFVNVTTSTTHNFTVVCTYTDETNTARTKTLPFSDLSGTTITSIANAGGAVPYSGIPFKVRCKAGTTLSIGTAGGGTYTGVVYDIYANVVQVAK